MVSDDLADVRFVCDCSACLGGCCVHGDAGAPLTDLEIGQLTDHLTKIIPYMRREGVKTVNTFGVFVTDVEGVKGTPLINGKECAFVNFHGEVAICSIEKAWEQKKIPFRKPVSCHLYPVRITDYKDFEAVNYHKWDICKPALVNGRKAKVFLFEFLKDALIRKYGEDWYAELEQIIQYMKQKKSNR